MSSDVNKFMATMSNEYAPEVVAPATLRELQHVQWEAEVNGYKDGAAEKLSVLEPPQYQWRGNSNSLTDRFIQRTAFYAQ